MTIEKHLKIFLSKLLLLGNAGDSLSYHNGMAFSTKDSDNDTNGGNCATSYKGTWWYKSCYLSNLNGHYYSRAYSSWSGVVWHRWKNNNQSLKFSEMKIKP